jgi:Bacterial regulatory proteins, luxR family
VLTAIAQRLPNPAIAKQLRVSPQTVKYHLANIFTKLGVTNRTEAARLAYQRGLVDRPLGTGDGIRGPDFRVGSRLDPSRHGSASSSPEDWTFAAPKVRAGVTA